jgi:hypothetical protein
MEIRSALHIITGCHTEAFTLLLVVLERSVDGRHLLHCKQQARAGFQGKRVAYTVYYTHIPTTHPTTHTCIQTHNGAL